MLIEAVQSSSDAAASFELDEDDFVQAVFEDLCCNIRHSMVNCGIELPVAVRFLKISPESVSMYDQ